MAEQIGIQIDWMMSFRSVDLKQCKTDGIGLRFAAGMDDHALQQGVVHIDGKFHASFIPATYLPPSKIGACRGA